jgi:hypothetical protein
MNYPLQSAGIFAFHISMSGGRVPETSSWIVKILYLMDGESEYYSS